MRLLTEEWIQFKRSGEDEILAAFQTLDVEKKGFLEQVLRPPLFPHAWPTQRELSLLPLIVYRCCLGR